MNKFFIISDVHLDAVTAGVKRFTEVKDAAWAVAQQAKNEGAGFVFGGDLCDPDALDSHRCTAEAVELACQLRVWNVPQLWLVGNHDIVEDGQQTTTLDPVHAAIGCVIRKPDTVAAFGDFALGLLPYTAKTHHYDPSLAIHEWSQNAIAGLCKPPDVIIGHLDSITLQPGSETDGMARGRRLEWPLAELDRQFPNATLIGGHYHRGQQKGPLHIVGAPARFTFGESDHEPGYLSVELKKGRAGKRSVTVERHRFANARRVYSIGGRDAVAKVQAADIVRILVPADDGSNVMEAMCAELESELLLGGAAAVRFKTLQHGERAPTDLIDRPGDGRVSAEDGFEAARRLAREWPAAEEAFNTQLTALVTELEQQSR